MNNRAIALGLGLLALVSGAACDQQAAGNRAGNAGIDQFAVAGPNGVQRVGVGICTRFLPTQASGADTRPGLGWANGTGASPGTYAGILNRVASHGTLVTAANTTNSGTGTQVAQCINELDAARADSNGRFATAGHSQGGSGTLNAARLNNKVVVTCPVQLDGTFTATSSPNDLRGTANGPALIMCGGADTLAPCNRQGNGDGKFNGASVPVVRISVAGASHFVPSSASGGLYAALVTTCVEAALGGNAAALTALRPGGAVSNNVITVTRRNF